MLERRSCVPHPCVKTISVDLGRVPLRRPSCATTGRDRHLPTRPDECRSWATFLEQIERVPCKAPCSAVLDSARSLSCTFSHRSSCLSPVPSSQRRHATRPDSTRHSHRGWWRCVSSPGRGCSRLTATSPTGSWQTIGCARPSPRRPCWATTRSCSPRCPSCSTPGMPAKALSTCQQT